MAILQITTRVGCKIACTYCPQDKFITAYGEKGGNLLMSLDQFRAYLDKIPQDVEVCFAGFCEPWLNSECIQMVLYAKRKGHVVSIFTTMVGMTALDIELLEPLDFGFFRIHLPSESGDEEIPVTKEYLATLELLINSKINAGFHCQSSKSDPNVMALLKKNGKNIMFSRTCHRSGNVKLKGKRDMPRRRGKIGCKRDMLENLLLPNGDILLCPHDYGIKHLLGNISSLSYEELFEGSEFKRIQEAHQDIRQEVICRYCEEFCCNVDLFSGIMNIRYRIDQLCYDLRAVRNLHDLWVIFKRLIQLSIKNFGKSHSE
jgi:radical SAM protein with 4Fe4S-binding SPASM domain